MRHTHDSMPPNALIDPAMASLSCNIRNGILTRGVKLSFAKELSDV